MKILSDLGRKKTKKRELCYFHFCFGRFSLVNHVSKTSLISVTALPNKHFDWEIVLKFLVIYSFMWKKKYCRESVRNMHSFFRPILFLIFFTFCFRVVLKTSHFIISNDAVKYLCIIKYSDEIWSRGYFYSSIKIQNTIFEDFFSFANPLIGDVILLFY